MDSRFFHIAQIDFRHEFSGSDPFEGFSWSLSQDSILTAQNLGLLCKSIPGGIVVLSSSPELLIENNELIQFKIFPSDPLFFNFTDMGEDFRPNSKVLFFEATTDTSDSFIVHKGEFASVADSLNLFRASSLPDLLLKLGSGELSLLDSEGNQIIENQLKGFFSEPKESVFFVIDHGQRQGFFKPSIKMEKVPFGIFQISLKQLVDSYSKSKRKSSFLIQFKSRKTVWKYILSDKIYDRFSNLKVLDAQNQDFRFKESEFEINPSWKVRCFESEVALPFQNTGLPKFQLVEPDSNGQVLKVIAKQLPKATPESLGRDDKENKLLVSNIFI